MSSPISCDSPAIISEPMKLLCIIPYLNESHSYSSCSHLFCKCEFFSDLLSLIAFSYFVKSLLALSNIKSHKTSNEYFCLISFFSNNSATSVILYLISSCSLAFASISFSKFIILSNDSSIPRCASFTYYSKSSHNYSNAFLSYNSSSFSFYILMTKGEDFSSIYWDGY